MMHTIWFSCVAHLLVYSIERDAASCLLSYLLKCLYSVLISRVKSKLDIFLYCESTFIFVGTKFRGLGKTYQFIESWICRFDNSIIQTKWKFIFRWEPNFLVYRTHTNHENWYPRNNNTFTVVCLIVVFFHYCPRLADIWVLTNMLNPATYFMCLFQARNL